MYNIAVIGAGQLGSRHVQGLKYARMELSIFVYDVNLESLQVTRSRFLEIDDDTKFRKELYLCSSYEELPKQIDLAIISTTSLFRANATKELISHTIVKNIIFEKFLFPIMNEYDEISNLLVRNNISAWVNCVSRSYDYYNLIYNLIQCDSNFHMSVSGGDWGLACNSIHFVDLFAWFSKNDKIRYDISKIDNEVHLSKRNGYVEFTGTLLGKTSNGTILLTSSKNSTEPICIHLNTEHYSVLINGSIMCINDKLYYIYTPFQSQISGLQVEEILLNSNSSLVSYDKSVILHKELLNSFKQVYNRVLSNNDNCCPIT